MLGTTYPVNLFAHVLARYQKIPEGCAVAHCLAKIEAQVPPTERLIFPAGDFITTKGTFLFDAQAATTVMADWNDWTGGQPQHGSSDFEHDQASDKIPGHEKLDSSKYDLELRAGALWAVNIVWTALAADMIVKGHKRFTSPWWLYEKASKRIIRYINFGLVSMPATIAQPELLAAAAGGSAGAVVQVPDCFAGYATEVASAVIPPIIEPAAAAFEPVATTPTPVSVMPNYEDPNFKPAMHGWDLRDMASHAFANMQLAVRLHNEVPQLASAMNLGSHVASMAEHVSHCAAAMVHHMTAGEEDMPEDVDASKLPTELAAKVTAAVAACKAAKCGGGRAGIAAASLSVTGQKTAEAATAALAALEQAKTAAETAATAAAATAAASLAAEQAKTAEESAKRQAAETARAAAEKAADQVKYDALIAANRAKVPKGPSEEWVRANVVAKEAKDGQAAMTASEALAGYLATQKPVAVVVTHEPAASGLASVHQTAEEKRKIISEVELPASVLAAWVETGGGDERLFNEQAKEAKRLGLVN